MISKKNKRLLCEYVDYTCEACGKVFKLEKLDIHRLCRGNKGGTYEFRNCKILCKGCHKLFHANEFTNVQGK